RLASKSPKRRAPKKASRTISRVHQSPMASSAWAIPQFIPSKRLRPMPGESLAQMVASCNQIAYPSSHMAERVCVVTGVGPGTGAALVRRFADDGYRVAMLARDRVRLEK